MQTRLEIIGKSSISKYRNFFYHRAQGEQAANDYKSIIERNPERALTRAQHKAVHEYSRDVLGSSSYSPWLKVYTAYRGEFLEGWIPHNYFVSVLLPKWIRYPNLDAKIIFRRVLSLQQIPDIAYYFNGCWLNRDYRAIPRSALKDHLFSESDFVFVKLDRSWGGQAVWKLSRREFEPRRLASGAISSSSYRSCSTPSSNSLLRTTWRRSAY